MRRFMASMTPFNRLCGSLGKWGWIFKGKTQVLHPTSSLFSAISGNTYAVSFYQRLVQLIHGSSWKQNFFNIIHVIKGQHWLLLHESCIGRVKGHGMILCKSQVNKHKAFGSAKAEALQFLCWKAFLWKMKIDVFGRWVTCWTCLDKPEKLFFEGEEGIT